MGEPVHLPRSLSLAWEFLEGIRQTALLLLVLRPDESGQIGPADKA